MPKSKQKLTKKMTSSQSEDNSVERAVPIIKPKTQVQAKATNSALSQISVNVSQKRVLPTKKLN